MPVMKKPIAQLIPKPLWAAIVSLTAFSTVTAIEPAQAFSITYDFTAQITSDVYASQGVRQGEAVYGSFTYDNTNLTEVSDEHIFVAQQGNLTIQFNFLNNLYSEQNDLNYGSDAYRYAYPIAYFDREAQLIGLDFLVVPSSFQPPKNDLGFRVFKDAFYVGARSNDDSGIKVGTVTYSAAVPEPSEIGGAIVAFSFLGLLAVRKVTSQKQ